MSHRGRTCRGCGLVVDHDWNTTAVKCRACTYAYRKRKRNPEQSRQYHIKSMYGLSSEDHLAMVCRQNGCCALCGRSEDDCRFGRLAIDHDHRTGKVRGLLCASCNQALGFLNDDPDLLRRAATYLEAAR